MRRIEKYVSLCVIGGLILSSSLVFAGGAQESVPEVIEEDTEGFLEEVESPEATEEAVEETPEELAEEAEAEAVEVELKLIESEGIVITGIIEDSAAAKAGLLRGDIILTVEDVDVATLAEITDIINDLDHGDEITLGIIRGGEDMAISLTLESRIGWPLIGIYGMGPQQAQRGSKAGNAQNFNMEDLGELFERFGSEGFNSGEGPFSGSGRGFFLDEDIPEEYIEQVTEGNASIVSEVVADSPAEKSGIETGAIILAVDGEAVAEGDLKSAILAYNGNDTVTLTVYQAEEILEIDVTLGESDGSPVLGVRYYPAGSARMNQQFRGGGNMPNGLPNNDFDRMDG